MQGSDVPFGAALAPLSRYYVWQAPGGQIAVYLSLDLVRRLGALASSAPRSGAARPPEIGGLLLGRTVPGDTRVTVIEGFEPFPSAHVRGPSYTLVGPERRALGAMIRRRGRRPGLAVVGWFRTHTRPGLFLDQHDFSILTEFFSSPHDVCLLVGERGGAPAGGFFFWEESDIRRQSPYLTFPFDAGELLKGGHRIEKQAPGAPSVGAHLPAMTPPPSAPVPAPPAQRRVSLALAAMAVLALLAFGMLYRWMRPAAQPAFEPAGLSLQVEKSVGGLRLSWDREAPSIRRATGAVVRIDDGGRRHSITLTPRQLSLGSVMYFATSSDVGFELAVQGPDGERSEALRAVSAPLLAASFREPSAFPPLPVSAPPPLAPLPAAEPPVAGDASRSGPAVPASSPPAPEPKRARPLQENLWAHSEPAKMAALEAPPDLRLAPPARRPAPVPVTPPRTREAEVSYEPAKPSGLTGLVGKVPLLRRLQKEASPDYVAPRPVHQVKPAVPAVLAADTSVEIRVHIDESGRVLFAEVPAKLADSPLVKAAADAALEWRFTPARANGREVASDVLLRFDFE